MDVSKTTIQNWERGRTKVRPENVEKLAYHLNVSKMTLMAEMSQDADAARTERFPYFLFEAERIDDPDVQVSVAEERAAAGEAPSPYDTIEIIRSLHLNREQQELFGLICLYCPEQVNELYEPDVFHDVIRRIPYAFIARIGSIQYMELADGLHHVLRYVEPRSLMRVLRLYPEEAFDVTRLPKELIVDFLADGWVHLDEDQANAPYGLNIQIDIRKALRILPLLADMGEICLGEGDRAGTPLSAEVPQALKDAAEWQYGELTMVMQLCDGLYGVTDIRYDRSGVPVKCMWSINDKGRRLLEWYQEKE